MARVLVIEDDPDLRMVLHAMLQAEGYEVFLAGDGEQGMKQQRELKPDIVITDIFMPNKDGIETIREMREAYPKAKIIAMSGGGRLKSSASLEVLSSLGVDAFLRKPFDEKMLLDTVGAALRPATN